MTVARCASFLWLFVSFAPLVFSGTIVGNVRDQNWYARRSAADPFGVGYYEYAVNANATNLTSTGGFDDTDVFGAFSMPNLVAGSYTVASWDVWWRSAYVFNAPVPASGNSPRVDVRLNATMWGYPAFWDNTGYQEFGQTFTATGPVTMIYLRNPLTASFTHTVTIHDGSPDGAQIGGTRTFSGSGDHRLVYGFGEMPTVAGRTYYLRIRTPSTSQQGVIMQMDPRPDYSDPMPGGCLWLGNGNVRRAYPDRDLGVVIMSDDDGLITNMFTRKGGGDAGSVRSVGQSFIARGTSLVSAAFWLGDPAAPVYVVRVLKDGPGGEQIGPSKRNKPARVTADPEMMALWAPGECPLEPGQTYYLEVTRSDGANVNVAMYAPGNPYPFGSAFVNGVAQPTRDFAGTIMEEQSPGSATRASVRIVTGPTVSEADRGTNSVTIRWTTDVPSDSRVQWAADVPPYDREQIDAAPTTQHAVTLRGLAGNTLHHFRVQSAAEGFKPAISRDLVICTKASGPNLLQNAGFEEGDATSAASRPVVKWTVGGALDVKEARSSWFGLMPPHSGTWYLGGALNGGTSDGWAYQRVPATAGKQYNFSAWAYTKPQEKINNQTVVKYDAWDRRNRLIYVRLGIDPTGGINPAASTVEWTPRFYSHVHYSNVAKSAVARSGFVTVFVSMQGEGGGELEWHLFAIDDCVLTVAAPDLPILESAVVRDGAMEFRISAGGSTNAVEVSSNLVNWRFVSEVASTNGVGVFRDPEGTTDATRFYRAVAR